MQGFQLKKNRIGFRAVLLTLICILLISLFSNIGISLLIQDLQSLNINQDSFTPRGIGMLNQNPLTDVLVQQPSFFQEAQRLLSCKNNSFMTSFYGSVYGLFFFTTARFISLSDQISMIKTNNFLIAMYSPNAPPCTLAKSCLNHLINNKRSHYHE